MAGSVTAKEPHPLEKIDPIEDFKRAYAATKSVASVNRALGVLRHAINWGRGRTPPILNTSPFHRFGVKIKTKSEVKRDRRITPEEERRLLAAADKMNSAEHAFAGEPCAIASSARLRPVADSARC